MLTRSDTAKVKPQAPRHRRNPRRERRLWHDPEVASAALGCATCPEKEICGGLRLNTPFMDCLQFCCGNPEGCDRVCRNHPDFADRYREIGGFNLYSVPRAPLLNAVGLPRLVPVIYHPTARSMPPTAATVALPLYRMFDRRTGLPRFVSRDALGEAFGIGHQASVMLTGTDIDRPLERWWGLGEAGRRPIIQALIAAGVGMVTTPNYSLFIDRPRWDDLHAMKRIAIVHEEFLREGLPAALHVNGRTEADFAHWIAFLAARPEVTHIAYEFTTGTGWSGRREQHAAWLAGLARAVGRPLHIIVRGGTDVLPVIARAFSGITVLDTSVFMKTMMRQQAYPKGNAALGWRGAPTAQGAHVDHLLEANWQATDAWIGDLIASSRSAESAPMAG
ncbi:MAG: hypothetical protein ABGW82_02630 [Paracoccus sp. (in: a-proteobacteria)]